MIMKKKKPQTISERIEAQIKAVKKQLKRKAFRFQLKMALTIILPAVITALAAAAARIFLRMKLRSTASGLIHVTEPALKAAEDSEPSEPGPQPQPAEMETFRPEFITPEAVD